MDVDAHPQSSGPADPAEASDAPRKQPGRRWVVLAVAAVLTLALVGAGAWMVWQATRPTVTVTLPDRLGSVTGPASSADMNLCGRSSQALLRPATGPVKLEVALDGEASNPTGVETETGFLLLSPEVTLHNEPSARDDIFTWETYGFVVVDEAGTVVASQSGMASGPTDGEPRKLSPGESTVLHSAGFSGCDGAVIPQGVYAVYGATFVAAGTRSADVGESFLVISDPSTLTITYGDDGLTLRASLEQGAPAARPGAADPIVWPEELLLDGSFRGPAHPLAVVWLLTEAPDDQTFLDDRERLTERLGSIGYTGSTLQLTCQPSAVSPLGLPEGTPPEDARGHAVVFEDPADASTFAEQFLAQNGKVVAVVEGEVFCE